MQKPKQAKQKVPEVSEHVAPQAKRRKIDRSNSKTGSSNANPYLEFYHQKMASFPVSMKRLLDPALDDDERVDLFNLLDVEFAEQYSWAVVDERAVQIIKSFGPIVEMGAGNGYLGHVLQQHGVTWSGFDVQAIEVTDAVPGPGAWADVHVGSPKKLSSFKNRSLLLCYPDFGDTQSDDQTQTMSLQCLQHYKGDTIITIGEWFGSTFAENPWGKSFDAIFQQEIVASFHCVIRCTLPTWPGSCDILQVWKRTPLCRIDDELIFKWVPEDERIGSVLLVMVSPNQSDSTVEPVQSRPSCAEIFTAHCLIQVRHL